MMIKKRKLFSKLINFIEDKEIIVIHGSRQVGKTSLLRYIIDNYLKNISIEKNIFYFDLEDFHLLDLCNGHIGDVIAYLKAKGADFNQRIYLFIDEIQYLENPSSFLKLFYETYQEKIKLVVSGSSSFLIKKKFKDSLAGRILDFELFTLDFEEFLGFRELGYNLNERLPEPLEEEIKKAYEEFVIYGGYPAIVLEEVIEKKEMKLKQIINAYIKKDIRDLAEIRDVDKFNDLLKILASQVGNLLNILEISSTLGLAKQTVQEYIFLLENTYIVRRVRPFHKNVRTELTKMPKIFFEDTGMANILANRAFSSRIEGGLLENSVYSQLRKNLSVEDIYFWRTNRKQEVDFIVDYLDKEKKNKLAAVEVKNIFLNKHTSNLRCFQKEYLLSTAYFCSLSKKESTKNKSINSIYPWELLPILESKKVMSIDAVGR